MGGREVKWKGRIKPCFPFQYNWRQVKEETDSPCRHLASLVLAECRERWTESKGGVGGGWWVKEWIRRYWQGEEEEEVKEKTEWKDLGDYGTADEVREDKNKSQNNK